MSNVFAFNKFRMSPEQAAEFLAVKAVPQHKIESEKVRKRREGFIMVPMDWHERLCGASGCTIIVAQRLLFLHWKAKGKPITLANGALAADGVARNAKVKALQELERRGLVSVEWRQRKSPISDCVGLNCIRLGYTVSILSSLLVSLSTSQIILLPYRGED
jgi:hypothetical protein